MRRVWWAVGTSCASGPAGQGGHWALLEQRLEQRGPVREDEQARGHVQVLEEVAPGDEQVAQLAPHRGAGTARHTAIGASKTGAHAHRTH